MFIDFYQHKFSVPSGGPPFINRIDSNSSFARVAAVERSADRSPRRPGLGALAETNFCRTEHQLKLGRFPFDSCAPAHFDLSVYPSMSLACPRLRSLVAYPRDFAFYVADHISSIHRCIRVPIRNPCHRRNPWLAFRPKIRVYSCPFVVTQSSVFSGTMGATRRSQPMANDGGKIMFHLLWYILSG